ncbi:hypothetical protein [Peptoniphilus harei]|nr:hypothetical protein [Peptoniphilus harei]
MKLLTKHKIINEEYNKGLGLEDLADKLHLSKIISAHFLRKRLALPSANT